MAIERVYWDSDCFLGVFKGEPDKVNKCQGTIKAAEEGTLIIVTSAITLTEVIKLKKKPGLAKNDEQRIVDFFKHKYIYIQNVDRKTAEYARQLIWKRGGLWPKDSIHVATAIIRKTTKLHTFDSYLLKLNNKLGNPKLRICEPDIPYQADLF